jgi:hypothetical protein
LPKFILGSFPSAWLIYQRMLQLVQSEAQLRIMLFHFTMSLEVCSRRFVIIVENISGIRSNPVHEGGYSIQAVANNQTGLNEQFSQQQHISDASMFGFEKELRNDRESFNRVRSLSQTTYRFRVFDADGRDIGGSHHAEKCKADIPTKGDSQITSKPVHHYGCGHNHSTRVECAEPKLGYYFSGKRGKVTEVSVVEHRK